MYILGLNAYHGDSSACLMRDGEVIAACEEERFNRVKHWVGLPIEAIKECLKIGNISAEELDHITIGRDPKAKFFSKLKYQLSSYKSIVASFTRLRNVKEVASLRDSLVKGLGINASSLKAQIHNIEHHRSHLGCAFFSSPFEEAAILSIDGSGDFTTVMAARGAGNNIEVLDSLDFPISIGRFYTSFTQYLGFPYYGDEYKVMGLSPYGKPKYCEELRKIIFPTSNGFFSWDSSYFLGPREGHYMKIKDHIFLPDRMYSDKVEELFGPARQKGEELTQKHMDIAASIQQVTEELIFHMLEHLQKRTGLTKVCIAGGVAQNSVANGKIITQTKFEEIYVPNASHDAGISIGSAIYLYNQILKKERTEPLFNPYTGSSFSNDEIKVFLDKNELTYTFYEQEELIDVVTDCIINEGVIGWFQDEAEFGPRALGNRSILADPRNEKAKELLNLKIKKRESFRPFAPSILKEHVGEYFELNESSPFMERVLPIKAEKHEVIPAVTHVNGSGRLQTVEASINRKYYDLIKKFYDKTGLPILLNTSFNENEPIVNNPQHAIDCYLRTQMDMLVLGNYVLER